MTPTEEEGSEDCDLSILFEGSTDERPITLQDIKEGALKQANA